ARDLLLRALALLGGCPQLLREPPARLLLLVPRLPVEDRLRQYVVEELIADAPGHAQRRRDGAQDPEVARGELVEDRPQLLRLDMRPLGEVVEPVRDLGPRRRHEAVEDRRENALLVLGELVDGVT